MNTRSGEPKIGLLAALLLFIIGFVGFAILGGFILILLITLGRLPGI